MHLFINHSYVLWRNFLIFLLLGYVILIIIITRTGSHITKEYFNMTNQKFVIAIYLRITRYLAYSPCNQSGNRSENYAGQCNGIDIMQAFWKDFAIDRLNTLY